MLSGVSIRARTKCRIARFELQQLQELIQDSAPSSEPILSKMIERVLLAQRYAKAVPKSRPVISGPTDGRVAQEIRSFLAGNRIPYEWENRRQDSEITGAQRVEWTVLVDGVHELRNPKLRALAESLVFKPDPGAPATISLWSALAPQGWPQRCMEPQRGLASSWWSACTWEGRLALRLESRIIWAFPVAFPVMI